MKKKKSKFLALLMCMLMVVSSIATSMVFAEDGPGEDSSETEKEIETEIEDLNNYDNNGVKFGHSIKVKDVNGNEITFTNEDGDDDDYEAVGKIELSSSVEIVALDGKTYIVTLAKDDDDDDDDWDYDVTSVTLKDTKPDPNPGESKPAEQVTAHFYVHITEGIPDNEAGQKPQDAKNYYKVGTATITLPTQFTFQAPNGKDWKTYFTNMEGKEVQALVGVGPSYDLNEIFGNHGDFSEGAKIVWYVIKDQPNDGTGRYHVDGYIIGTEYLNLTYDANTTDTTTGTLPESVRKVAGTTVTLATKSEVTLSRAGYTFDGWSTIKGENNESGRLTSVTLEKNKTVYAIWKKDAEKTYNITYNKNTTDTVKNMPGNEENKVNGTYSLSETVPTREGYVFKGWSLSETGAIVTKAEVKDANVEVFAIWQKTWKVTYHANAEDSTIGGIPSATTHEAGTDVTFSNDNPTRTHYTFMGWSLEGNEQIAEGVKSISADVDVYAIWKEDTKYTLTYDENAGNEEVGGMPAPSIVTGLYAGIQPLNNNVTPIRAGYKFMGWSLTPTNQINVLTAEIVDKSITVYAMWEEVYTVTYNANAGTDENIDVPASITKIEKNTGVTLTGSPTRAKYVFKGWSRNSGDNIDSIIEGNKLTNITENITVYAVWQPTTKFTLTYVANTGDTDQDSLVIMPNSKTALENGDVVTLEAASTNRYRFIGWSLAKNDNNVVTSVTINNSDVTVYGVWEKLPTYGIKYNANAGTDTVTEMPDNKTDLLNGSYELDTTHNPKRTGYTFVGWAKEAGLTDKITEVTIEGADKEVFAIWTKDEVVVPPYVPPYTPPVVDPTPTPTPDPTPTPLPDDEFLVDDDENNDSSTPGNGNNTNLPEDEFLVDTETEDPTLPKTGDEGQLMIWLSLLGLTFVSLGSVVAYKRKESK